MTPKRPIWYRSSPILGAFGGAASAAWYDATGAALTSSGFDLATGLADALFSVHPLVGYLGFVGLGVALGSLFARIDADESE
ncbi:hypothetical protein ACFQMA_00445 [Halosimplex aquaticum]|uniref:Uncharacterized protein n=1 Tax=Halosimplex aquaticum TaxID=3026162 RepID=A0ABD5XYM8_9EURY|nr:hypothetical protein [Halosimplex aquaticum]